MARYISQYVDVVTNGSMIIMKYVEKNIEILCDEIVYIPQITKLCSV